MDRKANIGALRVKGGQWCWWVLASMMCFGTCAAQIVTTYAYDNLKHVTQASSTDGTNVQYQYDANGNLITATRANASALTLDKSFNVNLLVPGQSVTLSFSASSGQSVILNLASITSSPAGSAVAISVGSGLFGMARTRNRRET